MVELDYPRLAAEAESGNFEAVGEALGLVVDAPAWAALAASRVSTASVLAAVRRASSAEGGLVWEVHGRTHVLVVSMDAHVAIGFGQAREVKSPASAWPSLAGWRPAPEDNVGLARRWAATAAQVTLPRRGDARSATLDAAVEAGFRAAIVEAPDDDQRRLVYADWLMEHGDVRGELIRLQLEAAPTKATTKRVEAILSAGWRNLAGELAPYADASCFRRGFIERVRLTPADFAAQGARLFEKHPLRTLVVAAKPRGRDDLTVLARAPGVAKVRRLELTWPGDGLAPLAKGRFSALRELSLTSCGRDGADWAALFSGLDAPLLETVELSNNLSHPSLWRALATNPRLENLTTIDEFVDAGLGDEADDAELAAAMRGFAEHHPKLKTLIISSSRHLNDETLHPLFAASSVVALETFDVDGTRLSDETLRAWRRGGRLGALRSLTVRNTFFTPEAVAEFLDEGCPPKLEHLAFTTFDELRWNHDALGTVYEALLRLPKTAPLKRLALPPGRRGYDALWSKLSRRFEVQP